MIEMGYAMVLDAYSRLYVSAARMERVKSMLSSSSHPWYCIHSALHHSMLTDR
jgi:hypothetical protein